MAKRPDHMTPEERLTRIYSLERRVLNAEWRADQAERRAEERLGAWRRERDEVRRLEDIIVQRYDTFVALVKSREGGK